MGIKSFKPILTIAKIRGSRKLHSSPALYRAGNYKLNKNTSVTKQIIILNHHLITINKFAFFFFQKNTSR